MLTTEQYNKLNWDKTLGMIPVIVQHHISGEVLMHGYMNKDALQMTITNKQVTFYSRTKKRLWTKGETSGDFLNVINITLDCDGDTLLVFASNIGSTCHLKTFSCFSPNMSDLTFLYHLELLVSQRKNAEPSTSYTAKLYSRGTKRIAQKVGEEGLETALAATVNNRKELINEASDLMYHLIVLLQSQNLDLSAVVKNLKIRNYK